MEITTPYAKVIVDESTILNMFLIHDVSNSRFKYYNIGDGIVNFCEMDFSKSLDEIKKLNTIKVSSKNIKIIKNLQIFLIISDIRFEILLYL